MKNTERFSDRVANYVQYRPHYPKTVLFFLKQQLGLDPHSTIADIGSGTSISTELFLENNNVVYAVEPNKEMREAAEKIFNGNKNFISINGTAEVTTLPDSAIDLIVVAQAFHWFDKKAAKNEFQRIARPNGRILLMWNEREFESPFHKEYEQLLIDFALSYEGVCQRNIDEAAIKEFFAPNTYSYCVLRNIQYFDFESLKGRLLSSSYAPLENHPNYKPMIQRLKQIFDRYNIEGEIEFPYNCKLYYGNAN